MIKSFAVQVPIQNIFFSLIYYMKEKPVVLEAAEQDTL
jgi:hypothetical protein